MDQFVEYIINSIKESSSSEESNDEGGSKEPVKEIEKKREIEEVVLNTPPRLFYTKEDEHRHNIKILKKIFVEAPKDRVSEPRPLFHATSKINPILKLESLPFHPSITCSLEQLNYWAPKSIQMYMWPVLLRGFSTFVVAPTNGYKTTSYTPILSNFTLNTSGVVKDKSPVILVICPKVSKVEKVYREFKLLLKSTAKSECIQAFTHRINAKVEKNIEIVITTPKILIDLCKTKILRLICLRYVVLEDADVTTSMFWNETLFLMEKMEEAIQKRNDFNSIQIITLSEKWNANLEKFALMLQIPPTTVINDHIEAAYYGRTKIKFHFVKQELKGYKIVEILERNLFRGYKTVILCESISQKMMDYLDVHGVIYYLVTQETNSIDFITRWHGLKRGNYFALLCTDEIFKNKLAITDAEIIIQYSLPADMSDFEYRFSGFVDSYDNISETEPEKMRKNIMHILIDDDDFEGLLQVFEKLYAVFHEDFSELYKYLKNEIETRKINNGVILCENYLLYEACTGITCPYRHKMNKELDINPRLPRKGLVGVKILYFESPVKLICRINHTYFCNDEEKCWEVPDEHNEIVKQLADMKYMLTPIQRKDMKAGMLCVAEMELKQGEIRGRIERGKIMQIPKRSSRVLIKFIDAGLEKYVASDLVFYMPDDLEGYTDQTITVYIQDIIPPDMDVSWPSCFAAWLNNEVHKYDSFVGEIELQISEGIFVRDLFLVIEPGHTFSEPISVRGLLSKIGILRNTDHMNFLYDLCAKSNVPKTDLE